ncbi:MAG: Glycosyl transferase, WecB/TagA/CpsF family [Microgenomates group bacterium GW2011_GWA1_48_10]|uniref:Uncharacterized protein n=1 Tax=Candidatus Gottesmanbacteria bacterium RIFCSPHIGHO2_01_FULL_47_48 TaxID=1798381 RepID=A0A1F6A4K2_9BACT|nr:MAG: Glycosyl transferase, WecB/TagA/CpsF family [Microgenomates group bacterium GW2011_GWA1_48_10]OGG19372.1 MAG: hypothetical protein A2721_02475 [Candidatus Gottesmanbacteria bacterium RIFCSPHIGHO2_01_FULL_47_48]
MLILGRKKSVHRFEIGDLRFENSISCNNLIGERRKMLKKVLGVRINDLPESQAVRVVTSWLKKTTGSRFTVHGSRLIFTPGPEFIVTAQKDLEFREILNASDLNVPDGFGLKFAGIENRVLGVDLMVRLCEEAAKNDWSVGLLGGRGGVAGKAAKKLQEKFPKLQIGYALSDGKADQVLRYYFIDSSITLSYDKVTDKLSLMPEVDLLFVAFGHPTQEKLLWKMKKEKEEMKGNSQFSIPNSQFRVGMGVGGSFDFISGEVWEPTGWWSQMGLKWLGRLLSNPGHIKRVVRAVIVFPALLLRDKLLGKPQ